MLEAIDLTMQDICPNPSCIATNINVSNTQNLSKQPRTHEPNFASRKRKRDKSKPPPLRDSSFTMGNTVTVMSGDFRQILPIIPQGSRTQTVNATLKKSILWPQVIYF
jgi:hypothetical protein